MKLYKKIIYSLFLMFVFVSSSYAHNDNSNATTLRMENADIDTIKNLIEQGFTIATLTKENNNVDTVEQDSITLTMENADIDTIKNLIEQGFTIATLTKENNDRDGNTLGEKDSNLKDPKPSITLTKENSDMNSLRNFINQGYKLDARNRFGHKALLNAALDDEIEVAKALIEGGADVDARIGLGYATPLHEAIIGGHVKMVRLLIEAGADVNIRFYGWWTSQTPLDIAFWMGHAEIARLLRSAGAELFSNKY